MKQDLKVSVCMITYGHEKYIREAIEGVLMQQCNFEVELILANDCSPDQTDKVIQDILLNHPKASWIKYFKHEKNIGMIPNFMFALQQCKGKYIALCEGDDYWTDSFKLQKQVDFLDLNPDYVLSFHQVDVLKPDGSIVEDFITKVPANYENIQTLAKFGNYIHTPSVVFRNLIKEFPFQFELSPLGDYFLYMLLAEHGKLKCLKDKMCVYRFGVGIHSSQTSIKMAKANVKIFTLLLSYFKQEEINKIFLDRQFNTLDRLEIFVRAEYNDAFISTNFFLRNIKHLNKPKKLYRKLIKRFYAK